MTYEFRYSPQMLKKLELQARRAPEARFSSSAALMAWLNKPTPKKNTKKRKRS